ncbi:MAG: flagellar biosynthesis anti-sigma factor FlgM [Nitrospinota bacterium]
MSIKVEGSLESFENNKLSNSSKVKRDYSATELSNQNSTAKECNKTDNLSLSLRSKEISKVIATINSTPDIRHEKVDPIKDKITNGEYQINANTLADKVLFDVIKNS